jgi:hypothetical protein
MSGPKPGYPINLTEAEVKSLQQQERAHKTGQSIAVRARILLNANAHAEWSNGQIGKAAGTSDRIVRKWRCRWVTTHSIADAPRSGAPRHFPPSNACASDRHGMQSATTKHGTAEPLESCGDQTAGGSQHARTASPFQQNRRTLAQS